MSICFEYATGWRLQLIFNDVPFSFQKRGHGDCSRMWSRMHGNTGPGPFDCFLVEKWMIKLFNIEIKQKN